MAEKRGFEMIRLIFWDVDGTVLDFHAAQKDAIRACFEEFRLGECTDEMLAVYNELNNEAWRRLERKEITKEECLLSRFEKFFTGYGIPTDCVKEFNASYQIRLGDFPVFHKNAKETLLKLKAEGIPQFAVTNGTYAAQNKKLRTTGLIDIFDEVFISDVIGIEKPDPRFFAPALKAAETYVPGIRKEEILIVGDSLTSDMQGGLNIGIRTCWFRTEEAAKKDHKPFDFETHDLSEVAEMIKK